MSKRRVALTFFAYVTGILVFGSCIYWALFTGVPFLIMKDTCPPLRWSAIMCPGLIVDVDYRLLPPLEGVYGWVYDPCAETLEALLMETSWVVDEGTCHIQSKPAIDLPYIGSEAQVPMDEYTPSIAAESAVWGRSDLGFAVVVDASYFGAVCGQRWPGYYAVLEKYPCHAPTPQ